MNVDEEYTFSVSERLKREYKFSSSLSRWIQSNLESIKDDNNKPLFNKVNFGYSDETLKTFGKRPVCDVQIGRVEYKDDLPDSIPEKVHTVLVFYFKGANDAAYLRCGDIHDYLIQEFINNPEFRMLEDVVDDTFIVDSELMNQPFNKKWGVMGAIELIHILI